MAEVSAGFAAYEGGLRKAMDALAKEAPRETSASVEQMNQARPMADRIDDLMTKMVNLKLSNAERLSADTDVIYGQVRTTLIALSVGGLVLGVAIGLVIAASLTGQLGGEPSYASMIADRIAEGDLTVEVETRPGDRGSLLLSMRTMREKLADIVGNVRSGTDMIATATGQIAAGNLDLSSRTEQQASALEETASSMEELTSTVKQNSEHAAQANQLARSASTVALKGGAVMDSVMANMASISDSSRKIGDIISVIDGIAFQTNILALNAAVEAARAGEQSRGFAVVASEVRNLAQRSAAAAKEISTLIKDSVEKVDGGSKLVGEAGATMREVVQSVDRVSSIIGEITSASREQSSGIEQINQAICQMDEVVQQNAALVEEAAAATGALQEQADGLVQLVSVFKSAASQAAGQQFVKPAAPVLRLASNRTGRLAAPTAAKPAAPPPAHGRRGDQRLGSVLSVGAGCAGLGRAPWKRRQLDQAGAGQFVVQELAVLVEEGGQRPQQDACADRAQRLPLVQVQHQRRQQCRQHPHPAQQIAHGGRLQRQVVVAGAHHLQAPGLHRQRLAVAAPLVDEVGAQHQEGQRLAHVLQGRRVAAVDGDFKNQEGQEQHRETQQGFVDH